MLWIKLAIVAAILGSVGLYVASNERTKGKLKALETQYQTLALEDRRKGLEIGALNDRIKANNARWVEAIAAEKLRVDQATAAADDVRAERDRIKAALAQSRKSWDEVMANDANLRVWAGNDAPAAVWDRLRVASGQND